MTPRPEVTHSKVVNWVAQLACFLVRGDVFRKPQGKTQYRFDALISDRRLVVCMNADTRLSETIYSQARVFKRL
jgi:hypothetical protein